MAKEKKQDEGIDILEDPNAIVDKANEFFSSKRNKVLVFGIGGILAAIIVGIAGYNYYITNQNNTAQEELFQAQYYFEADSLGLALNGDGNSYGFLEIVDIREFGKLAGMPVTDSRHNSGRGEILGLIRIKWENSVQLIIWWYWLEIMLAIVILCILSPNCLKSLSIAWSTKMLRSAKNKMRSA